MGALNNRVSRMEGALNPPPTFMPRLVTVRCGDGAQVLIWPRSHAEAKLLEGQAPRRRGRVLKSRHSDAESGALRPRHQPVP